MKMNLYFHHYASRHVKSEDYFADIRAEIGYGYPYTYEDIGTIFIPVEINDLEAAKQKGLLLMDKKCGYGDFPHYIIREMIITFTGLNRDFEADRDHLISSFGKKAFKYTIYEEGLINV
jgi:hypothetical protein